MVFTISKFYLKKLRRICLWKNRLTVRKSKTDCTLDFSQIAQLRQNTVLFKSTIVLFLRSFTLLYSLWFQIFQKSFQILIRIFKKIRRTFFDSKIKTLCCISCDIRYNKSMSFRAKAFYFLQPRIFHNFSQFFKHRCEKLGLTCEIPIIFENRVTLSS